MAISGTVSVDYEIAEFVDEAFERLYISPESLTARHARSARRSLDLLLRQWSADVPHNWKISEQIYTPAQGENVISLDPGSYAVIDAVCRDPQGHDTPMIPISRTDWIEQVDKTNQGMPTEYWVEFLRDERRVHFWMAANADGNSLVFNVSSYISDVGLASNTVDLPPEWFEALCCGLAFHLVRKFCPPDLRRTLRPELERDYKEAYILARQTGHEHSEFRIEAPGACY